MDAELASVAALRRTVEALPPLDGQAAVLAVVTGHGGLWDLCVAGAGAQPASEGCLEAVAAAWSAALSAEGFHPTMGPRSLPGVASLSGTCSEVACKAPLRLQYRALGPDHGFRPLEALHAIEGVRQLSEQAVLQLGECLRAVLTASRGQQEELSHAARLADQPEVSAVPGLAAALQALERSSRSVHDTCTSALQALQYQDRAAQLLRHAAEQVAVLERLLGAEEATPHDVLGRAGAMGRLLQSDAEDTLQPSDVQLF